MGYCYQGRKLCCDACGKAGARKKKCPSGWCQPMAVCPECSKSRKVELKAYHVKNECAAKSAEFHARLAHEAALLAEGKALKCSAMNVGEKVHVIFKLGNGSHEGRYMSAAVYDAVPYNVPATPEEYAKHGEVLPAPSEYGNGGHSKEVR